MQFLESNEDYEDDDDDCTGRALIDKTIIRLTNSAKEQVTIMRLMADASRFASIRAESSQVSFIIVYSFQTNCMRLDMMSSLIGLAESSLDSAAAESQSENWEIKSSSIFIIILL